MKKIIPTCGLLLSLVSLQAVAVDPTGAQLTVKLNEAGETTTLSPQEFKSGKGFFNPTCGSASCHAGGKASDSGYGLGLQDLAGATPPRDNIVSLVNFMKDPMAYQGSPSISEMHPSMKSADMYPAMRRLTDDDLKAIAGYILSMPAINPQQWAVAPRSSAASGDLGQ